MKNTILLLLLAIAVTSCRTSYGVAFFLDLEKVTKDGMEEVHKPLSPSSYEDKLLAMNFEVVNNNLLVEIHNKTNEPIDIIWDKVSSVNPYGEAERIIHAGVAYADRYKSMANSTIPPHSYIKDNITTSRSVYYSILYKTWVDSYIYTWAFSNKKSAVHFAKENTGKPVRLHFHLTKGTETLTYDVQFKLVNPTFNFTSKDIQSLEVSFEKEDKVKNTMSDVYM